MLRDVHSNICTDRLVPLREGDEKKTTTFPDTKKNIYIHEMYLFIYLFIYVIYVCLENSIGWSKGKKRQKDGELNEFFLHDYFRQCLMASSCLSMCLCYFFFCVSIILHHKIVGQDSYFSVAASHKFSYLVFFFDQSRSYLFFEHSHTHKHTNSHLIVYADKHELIYFRLNHRKSPFAQCFCVNIQPNVPTLTEFIRFYLSWVQFKLHSAYFIAKRNSVKVPICVAKIAIWSSFHIKMINLTLSVR